MNIHNLRLNIDKILRRETKERANTRVQLKFLQNAYLTGMDRCNNSCSHDNMYTLEAGVQNVQLCSRTVAQDV